MFSTLFASALAISVGASRIQIHEADQAKFGASCDALQVTFRSRLVNFQVFLDANPDLEAISRASQARTMMKTYGIIRTLRRAKTCSWVVDNDSDDLEQMRSIVQRFLSGNPCADVARAELEAGASAKSGEVEFQSVLRAMSMLSSDNCEAREQPEQTANLDENADAQLADAEDDLQDFIEELEDPAGAALIQAESGTLRDFFRDIGVLFLTLFLLLACAGSSAIIGLMIWAALADLGYLAGFEMFVGATLGVLVGVPLGMAGCSATVLHQIFG